MKKNTTVMLCLVSLLAGGMVNGENTQKPQVVTLGANQTEKLNVDELSFVAKLNDQNRKAFTDRLTADQRKAVMVAVTNGTNADEAVQRMVEAREMREKASIVQAEKTDAATSSQLK